jgi:2-methylaconitate cis-trans-isomerase PrpF
VGFTDASGVFAALGVVDAGESYFNVSLYNTSIPDAEFAEAASRSSELKKLASVTIVGFEGTASSLSLSFVTSSDEDT